MTKQNEWVYCSTETRKVIISHWDFPPAITRVIHLDLFDVLWIVEHYSNFEVVDALSFQGEGLSGGYHW